MNLPQPKNESLRERKKRQTQYRILEAAAALFVEHGFHNTTVDSIADAADISKPTFFNYYESKLKVLQHLIDDADSHFLGFITEALLIKESTQERLRRIMLRSAKQIESNPNIAQLLLAQGLGTMADAEFAKRRFARLHSAMGGILQAGIEQGDIRRDYPPELLNQMVMGGYTYSLMGWMSDPDNDLPEALEKAANFLASALAPSQ